MVGIKVSSSTLVVTVVLVMLLGRLVWFPFAVFLVTGSSMYPVLKTGDLVIGEAVYLSGYREGDIVVWYRSISYGVIHEVIEKKPGYIITKGVNNPLPDPPVPCSSVKYKVILSIPRTIWIPLATVLLALYAYKRRRDLIKALSGAGTEPFSIALWIFAFFAVSNIAAIMLSGIYYGGYKTSVPVPSIELKALTHDQLNREVRISYRLSNTNIAGVNDCRIEALNEAFHCSYTEIQPGGILAVGVPEEAYSFLWTHSNTSLYRFSLSLNISLDKGVLIARYPVSGSWNRLLVKTEDHTLYIRNPNPVDIEALLTIVYYARDAFGLHPYNTTTQRITLQAGGNSTINLDDTGYEMARVKIEYKLTPRLEPVVEVYRLEAGQ